jgi:hypothetical protein
MKNSMLVIFASAALLSACGKSDTNSSDPNLNCGNYCNVITSACTTTNTQFNFLDNTNCLNFCNTVAWTPGAIDSVNTGNTLGCRIAHAQLAASPGPASVHCWHAGPTGGKVCGSYCDTYCQLALEACTGSNQLYPDAATCATACARIAVDPGLTAESGNNVQCRIWHLTEALIGDAAHKATHCPHGAEIRTAPPCGP